jgi:hypothetical protein
MRSAALNNRRPVSIHAVELLTSARKKTMSMMMLWTRFYAAGR